jgi:hypothetical protein
MIVPVSIWVLIIPSYPGGRGTGVRGRARTDRRTGGRIWEASRGWRIIAVGSRLLFAIRRSYQSNPSHIFTGCIRAITNFQQQRQPVTTMTDVLRQQRFIPDERTLLGSDPHAAPTLISGKVLRRRARKDKSKKIKERNDSPGIGHPLHRSPRVDHPSHYSPLVFFVT